MSILSDIGIAGGWLFLACLLSFIGLLALTWTDRQHPPTQPNPVYDALQREECPWCDTHECTNSALCNCKTPCRSWLCTVKEAGRG